MKQKQETSVLESQLSESSSPRAGKPSHQTPFNNTLELIYQKYLDLLVMVKEFLNI